MFCKYERYSTKKLELWALLTWWTVNENAENLVFDMRYKDSQNQINKGYNQARQDLQPSINSAFQDGFEQGTYNCVQTYRIKRIEILWKKC